MNNAEMKNCPKATYDGVNLFLFEKPVGIHGEMTMPSETRLKSTG